MTTNVNNDNFQAEVLDSKDVVLVDFYADWCGPCQGMLPAVNAVAADAPAGTKIVKVDIDAAPELAGKFGVMSIPTFIVFKGGEAVETSMGGGKSESDLKELMTKHV